MIAKQTRKFPGTVTRIKNTEKNAVKYERLLGGGTVAQWLLSIGKVIINCKFLPLAVVVVLQMSWFSWLLILIIDATCYFLNTYRDFTSLWSGLLCVCIRRLDQCQRSVNQNVYGFSPSLFHGMLQKINDRLILSGLLNLRLYTPKKISRWAEIHNLRKVSSCLSNRCQGRDIT